MAPLLLAILNYNTVARDMILARNPRMDHTLALFSAASQNDVPALRKLLDARPFLPYWRLSNGATALHIAALWASLDAFDLLVRKGADTNARDAQGNTPLHAALRYEKSALAARDIRAIVGRLLKRKADPNAISSDGRTPLHRAVAAADTELVRMLLSSGARVRVVDSNSETPLDLVTSANYNQAAAVDIATMLLNKGAEVNLVRTRNNGLSQLALRSFRPSTRSYALPGGPGTILGRAVAQGNTGLVALLLEKGADPNLTAPNSEPPLAQAMYSNNTQIIKLLIEKGADMEALSDRYRLSGDSLLTRAIMRGNIELVKLMLEKGADIKKVGRNSENALARAIDFNGNKEMIALLIEKGADVNALTSTGDTPLHRAINRGNKDLISLLIEKKARLDIKNAAGLTPLAQAVGARRDDIAAFLREKGAS